MELRRKSKKEWFQYMMLRRTHCYDIGFPAVYLSDQYIIMFWKCVP